LRFDGALEVAELASRVVTEATGEVGDQAAGLTDS
jgi:hypothetical protein